jgi:hypothetical protein
MPVDYVGPQAGLRVAAFRGRLGRCAHDRWQRRDVSRVQCLGLVGARGSAMAAAGKAHVPKFGNKMQ